MSYYDEEDYKGLAEFFWLAFKIAFNIAIIVLIYRFLNVPDFPEDIKETKFLYIFPAVGVLGAYLYLSFWIGWKYSKYVILALAAAGLFIWLLGWEAITLIYGLGFIGGIIYLIYLLIKIYILPIFKKR